MRCQGGGEGGPPVPCWQLCSKAPHLQQGSLKASQISHTPLKASFMPLSALQPHPLQNSPGPAH